MSECCNNRVFKFCLRDFNIKSKIIKSFYFIYRLKLSVWLKIYMI